MGSRESRTIRFAVGEAGELRSSVWRLWATGNDLYLAARSFGQITKISFHQSGIYRFALVKRSEEDPSAERALYKWKRPKEIAPGCTRCFGLVIPPRLTKMPFANALDNQKVIHLITPPQDGEKIVFNILLTHQGIPHQDILRNCAHNVTIHGCISMAQELAWLLSFPDTFTEEERQVVSNYFVGIKINLKVGSKPDSIHAAFAHLLDRGPQPFLTEIELGKENLNIALS